MLEPVLLFVAFILVLIGTYTDIRTREVPDWLNIAGIISGLGLRALWGGIANDWGVLFAGILGFGVFFVVGCLMFYAGQWGGGDSKLLMALGALFGFEFSLDNTLVAFIAWFLLAGAVYGMVWSIVLAVKRWNSFVSRYKLLLRSVRKLHKAVWVLFAFGSAFAVSVDDKLFQILFLITALLGPVLLYTIVGIKSVEQCCMISRKSPSQLTEGDWIAKKVVFKGKYVCGPKDLGIKKKQIALLKKMRIKSVLVKDGIPFVPTFLIGFLLMLWLGSPLAFFQ